MFPAGLVAQNKVLLSGEVKEKDGSPLPLVTVAVENTTSGTYTDDKGFYSLSVTPGKRTIIVTLLGYNTIKTTLDIRKNTKLDFVMEENSVTLNTVEIYGKTKSQQVKEGVFAVNALDVKPQVNTLKNLSEMVNRTTGIKIREEGGGRFRLRAVDQRHVEQLCPLFYRRDALGCQRKRCFAGELAGQYH